MNNPNIINDPINLATSCAVNFICRICLKQVENAKDLFAEHEESKEILDKIYLCFQIILSYESYLPSLICNTCSEELNSANNFRLKCVTFEERFTASYKQFSEGKKITVIKNFLDQSHECNDAELIGDTHEPVEADSILRSESHLQGGGIHKKETKYEIGAMKFKCKMCEKVLKTKASLLKHTISMHEKRKHVGKVMGTGVNRRYHCTKCLYVTPHSQTLVNHMRRHNGERPYHCECGKTFTQSSSLATHQKTHSSSTYYTCSTCGKQFKHAFTLKNHLRVHSTGIFSCNICQKKLKSEQSLQEHKRRHYNIRNFNCEDCGATFVACSDLLNHRKKHRTEKKVECHLCGYKTHTKKNLTMHLKRHAGEKPVKCDLCDVRVYSSSDLSRHRRVHTREKPFPCPACAQRFSHSPSLNKHVRNVHGIQYKWADNKSNKDAKQLTIKPEKL